MQWGEKVPKNDRNSVTDILLPSTKLLYAPTVERGWNLSLFVVARWTTNRLVSNSIPPTGWDTLRLMLDI